jgi:hypothetical protein
MQVAETKCVPFSMIVPVQDIGTARCVGMVQQLNMQEDPQHIISDKLPSNEVWSLEDRPVLEGHQEVIHQEHW